MPEAMRNIGKLTNYLPCIGRERSPDSPELHIHDLIACAGRDAIATAEGRGVRAARLRAIKADIAWNLGDCGLTVTALATRCSVTPRYIRKPFFVSEGLTFSGFVLRSRLAVAHRLLTDRRLAYSPIASVAFDAGFADLSYFNRTFRRQYDATPTDVRFRGSG